MNTTSLLPYSGSYSLMEDGVADFATDWTADDVSPHNLEHQVQCPAPVTDEPNDRLDSEDNRTVITESMSVTVSDEEKLQLLNKNTELRRLNAELMKLNQQWDEIYRNTTQRMQHTVHALQEEVHSLRQHSDKLSLMLEHEQVTCLLFLSKAIACCAWSFLGMGDYEDPVCAYLRTSVLQQQTTYVNASKRQIAQLQALQQTMFHHMDALDDYPRSKNIEQAKLMYIESGNCILKLANAPAQVSRDVLIHLPSHKDKKTAMEALKLQTPLHFESSHFCKTYGIQLWTGNLFSLARRSSGRLTVVAGGQLTLSQPLKRAAA
ncbi:Hypothetical predicted protein [Pelobates cultripes]|uniref:Uncharacterized protein n=1 Tax=Pelobates cultripes TaxID=61616 RepID=A0AAD1WJ77_PELCU|nr:Hypothetical predicted protein [Pelobates cultripes]